VTVFVLLQGFIELSAIVGIVVVPGTVDDRGICAVVLVMVSVSVAVTVSVTVSV